MKTSSARETALLCVRFALEKKALDVVLMDVSELSSLGDYFLLCSGRSDTQVHAIAQGIEENLKRLGVRLLSSEGATRGHWALLDFGDVIVHIFYEPIRQFYDLERLWSQAPRVALPEPYRSQAQEFASGDR